MDSQKVKVFDFSKDSENRSKTPLPAAIANQYDGSKEKQISAKVNSVTYDEFQTINRVQGMSNNSVINQLIFKYVQENQDILKLKDV